MKALPGAALVLGVPLRFFVRLFLSGLVLPEERCFFRTLRSNRDTGGARGHSLLVHSDGRFFLRELRSITVALPVGRILRRLRSDRDTEPHRDSIMLITAHAWVSEGCAYRDVDRSSGGPIHCHMVTLPICRRGMDLPEWVLIPRALKLLSCLSSVQIVVPDN